MLAFAADPHAFGIISAIAIGRCAAGADPLAAALMATMLFLQTLLQRLHDLVPIAQRLDLLHLFGAEILLRNGAQPFLRNVGLGNAIVALQPLEDAGEDLIEAIEQRLILHEGRAGEIVELFGPPRDHIALQRIEQHQMLFYACWNARGAQFVEKGEKHIGDPNTPRMH